MDLIGRAFLANTILLTEKNLDHIERAVAHLTDDEVWVRPNTATNSIGNLLLHLAGSHRFWVVSVVGGEPSDRQRQAEFDAEGGRSKAELLAALRLTVSDATEVLRRLDAATLLAVREALGREWRVLEAIQHTLTHFSLHTGQVLQLVKIQKGIDLALPR